MRRLHELIRRIAVTIGRAATAATLLAAMPAGIASAQGMAGAPASPVRDCRAGPEIDIPVIARGFDLIAIHATDDLVGPSIFDRQAEMPDGTALDIGVAPMDGYADSLDAYLACETPFLRTTHALMSEIAARTETDPRTEMIPVFFYGWSNGDRVLLGRNVDALSNLAGSELAAAPQDLGFALQMIEDAGDGAGVVVTPDPGGALAAPAGARFAVVSSEAARILTAGDVGTGAEGSVAGARALVSTTSASRVAGDILAVRRDFWEDNPDTVRTVIRALLKAEELFREDLKKQVVDFMRASEILHGGDPSREAALRRMWSGVESVGLAGQVDWADPDNARSFTRLINETQSRMVAAGLLDSAAGFATPPLDYAALGGDVWDKRRVETTAFDSDAASRAIREMSSAELDGNTIAQVTILFKPNQAVFPVAEYREAFEEALDKSQVYAGAVLSIEAHSSYLAYVDGVNRRGWTLPRQKRELASLRNTSTARALSVRDALLETADTLGLPLDPSQITIQGRGIEDPLGGFCGELPCRPKSEAEWKESRRVVFRVVQMESEAAVFTPLNDWN